MHTLKHDVLKFQDNLMNRIICRLVVNECVCEHKNLYTYILFLFEVILFQLDKYVLTMNKFFKIDMRINSAL